MPASTLTCAGCHGARGEGKTEGGVTAGNLTWSHLLKPYGHTHPSGRKHGPFDESCAIAEEWPLTGAAYRFHRAGYLYDRSLTARTSSRRMELQPLGYLHTFLRWASAVLFPWARTSPIVRVRHQTGER